MKTVLHSLYYITKSATPASEHFGKPAYHIVVQDFAETMEDVEILGGTARRERTLSMEQADKEGLTFDTVIDHINTDAILLGDAIREEIERVKNTLENIDLHPEARAVFDSFAQAFEKAEAKAIADARPIKPISTAPIGDMEIHGFFGSDLQTREDIQNRRPGFFRRMFGAE